MVITGRTRSGKSVLLYNLLYQLHGLPVQVCGIDPSGIVFNALGEGLGGSGWRVLTLRDPARACDVMHQIVAEMDRRIDLLLSRRIDKFGSFSPDFPCLWVVLEEYPGTLSALAAIDQANGAKAADRVEVRIRADVQRLALEGAKVGIKLVVVAQRADAQLLSGVLRAQLVRRISFSQDPDGLRMLHEGITPEQVEAAQRFAAGQAYAEFAGELPLTYFRADLLTYEQLADRYR